MALPFDMGPAPGAADERPHLQCRARDWLRAAAVSRPWLAGRWRHPLVGYAAAVLLVVAGAALSRLLVVSLPGYAFPAIPSLAAIAGVAITWGAGPSVVAAILASLLLNFYVLSPHLAWTFRGTADVVDFVLSLATGVAIALAVSRRQLARAITLSHDVTAIEAERNRLQQVLDVLPEGILLASAHPPAVAAMNRAAEEFVGVNLVGQPVPIPPPGARGEFAARRLDGTPYPIEELPLERALLRGEVVRGEQFLIRNATTGRETMILANSAPLRNAQGAVDGAVEVFQDITAMMDLERQREEFLATVSHDLKNPLTGILGMSQLLQRHIAPIPEPERARFDEGLGIIARTAQQMTAQLNELLDLTRAGMGRPLQLELTPTDIVALVARVVDEYQRTTERHTLRLEHEDCSVVGMIDAPRLQRAVANLLANAIKYSPEGGEIRTTVTCTEEPDGAWLTIGVADSGIGIPRAELDRVVEGFYRASNAVGQFTGSGLGLAGVRQVITQHGGTVALESAEGAGTMVTVRLPLRPPPTTGES